VEERLRKEFTQAGSYTLQYIKSLQADKEKLQDQLNSKDKEFEQLKAKLITESKEKPSKETGKKFIEAIMVMKMCLCKHTHFLFSIFPE